MTSQARVRTEMVWPNFEPAGMHWAGHAEKNATDRQRIKREAARWAEEYRTMPSDERLAVVSTMMAAEAR